MTIRKFLPAIAIGGVLLFFGVGFGQTTPPQFHPPVNLGPKINTSAFEADPFWDAPRKRLYFVSARDDFPDIWYSDWTDTGWADPVKLGPQINTGPDEEKSPSITPDGQKLYFVAGARQGFLWDIWVSTWNSSISDWGTPVNVGPLVNTPGVEFSAHISSNRQRLYFDSNGGGRCGFYVSTWNGSSWSAPVSMGVGQCDIAAYPSLTADEQWIYFDEHVSDGKSVFVSQKMGFTWALPADLRPQIGGRSSRSFITASGDSLFLSSAEIGEFGNEDIFLMKRKVPARVPALSFYLQVFLISLVVFTAFWWMRKFAKRAT